MIFAILFPPIRKNIINWPSFVLKFIKIHQRFENYQPIYFQIKAIFYYSMIFCFFAYINNNKIMWSTKLYNQFKKTTRVLQEKVQIINYRIHDRGTENGFILVY